MENTDVLTIDTVRLPKTAKPIRYDIRIVPDFKTNSFKGREYVGIEILKATSELVLNMKELEITSAALITSRLSFIESRNIKIDPEKQRVTICFNNELPKGCATLYISFKGSLKKDMAGFYLSAYRTPDGQEKVMAVTQFEDSDARKAFPCWDEPALKAKFQLTLEIPENMDALSNTDPLSLEVNFSGDKKIVSFGETPPMSTYLLAFAIGEFECIEDVTNTGVKVRVFTTRGNKEKGRFALEVGKKCLEFYDEYYGIPYRDFLPKLDMIAIPDFAFGAMENSGLVTFRETALLIDPKNSSTAGKQRVATVVAHELNHMWFGNLVTMEWWTQLWLNEGLTSFMEYLPLADLFPEWKMMEHFMSMEFASALKEDGLRTTHPIEVPINHPSEITQNFDAISYNKGASIVRMIYELLGPDKFREGMRLYIQRHRYGNAVTEDLWQAFEDVSGKPIRNIMDTWTKQPGYPIITMERHDSNTYWIRQSRFLSSGEQLTVDERNQIWQIPLSAISDKAINESLQTERESLFQAPNDFKWLKLNKDHTTFARICYTPKLWDALKNALAEGKLGVLDRFGIANDLHAFVKSGLLPATQLISMFDSYKNEQELIVWQQIVDALRDIEVVLPDNYTHMRFNTFAQHILHSITDKMGWLAIKDETHNDSLLRPLVLSVIGHFEDVNTLVHAETLFYEFTNGGRNLDPNLRSVVYNLSAMKKSRNDPYIFDALIKKYRESDLAEEKTRVLGAIGLFYDEALIRRALEFSLSGEVRTQDIFFVFGSAGRNKKIGEIAWQFAKGNWSELHKCHSGALTLLGRIVDGATNRFTTEKEALDVEEFFRSNPLPEISRKISQVVERIRSMTAWKKRDAENLKNWLEDWSILQ